MRDYLYLISSTIISHMEDSVCMKHKNLCLCQGIMLIPRVILAIPVPLMIYTSPNRLAGSMWVAHKLCCPETSVPGIRHVFFNMISLEKIPISIQWAPVQITIWIEERGEMGWKYLPELLLAYGILEVSQYDPWIEALFQGGKDALQYFVLGSISTSYRKFSWSSHSFGEERNNYQVIHPKVCKIFTKTTVGSY